MLGSSLATDAFMGDLRAYLGFFLPPIDYEIESLEVVSEPNWLYILPQ